MDKYSYRKYRTQTEKCLN